jgi:large subunit ribosomal protein L3
MGGERITVQNLSIVKIDAERNLLLVKGNVPGARKSLVTVKSAVKSK